MTRRAFVALAASVPDHFSDCAKLVAAALDPAAKIPNPKRIVFFNAKTTAEAHNRFRSVRRALILYRSIKAPCGEPGAGKWRKSGENALA